MPSESVVSSGNRQVVFVAKPSGYFEPREIKIGEQFDGKVQVPAGLKPGEKVVKSGNFLIDSESKLGAAMQDMRASIALPVETQSYVPALFDALGWFGGGGLTASAGGAGPAQVAYATGE